MGGQLFGGGWEGGFNCFFSIETHITWAFCRVGYSKSLPPLELKLPLLKHFMKVELIFNITCFKDIKIWVEQLVFN